ncbi:MAG: hypothetical protein HKN70_01970 [Gammaproteobacteria bacterium]|nr:hypothetical protein [Gammaproteobacteria bacterium]
MSSGKISSNEGKPGAPVSLAYQLPAAPAVGEESEIALTFTIDSAVDDVVITMTGAEGLKIMNPERLTLGAQKAGAEHTLTIKVLPSESGLRFVNLFADTVNGSRKLRRTFAVPVAGGGDQTLKKGNVDQQKMPDGEDVVILPAEETN